MEDKEVAADKGTDMIGLLRCYTTQVGDRELEQRCEDTIESSGIVRDVVWAIEKARDIANNQGLSNDERTIMSIALLIIMRAIG